jgi:hypothetical protein
LQCHSGWVLRQWCAVYASNRLCKCVGCVIRTLLNYNESLMCRLCCKQLCCPQNNTCCVARCCAPGSECCIAKNSASTSNCCVPPYHCTDTGICAKPNGILQASTTQDSLPHWSTDTNTNTNTNTNQYQYQTKQPQRNTAIDPMDSDRSKQQRTMAEASA